MQVKKYTNKSLLLQIPSLENENQKWHKTDSDVSV